MQIKTAFVLVTAVASASAIGCGSSGSSNDGPTGTARASLHRAKSCGDLLTDLQADATYKLNKGIDRQIQTIQACQQQSTDANCAYGGYGGGYGSGSSFDDAGERAASDAAAPTAPAPDATSGSGPSSSSAGSYSETNTQVKGVDEADIVKNDGKNLYVLHGRAFKVLNAWPADALAEMSSIDIEGQPSEMFVADGKVVVYSQVNGTSIFSAAGVTPKQQYQEYGYGYGYGSSMDRAEPATAIPGSPGASSGPYTPLTKITVLTLDGTTPTVTREVYFEGGYLDSRRVGTHVRTVLQSYQYGPQLKYGIYELPEYAFTDSNTDPSGAPSANNPYPKTGTEMITALEQLRAANLAAIGATQITDWLPYTFVKEGAAVTSKTVACEDFYVPNAGSTESGLTEIATLDLSNPGAVPRETAILGRADTVYGTADTLYLAARAWIEPPFMWSGGTASSGGMAGSGGSDSISVAPDTAPSPPADAGAPSQPPPDAQPTPGPKPASLRPLADPAQPSAPVVAWSTANTHVHKFEFTSDPTFANYVASGTVAGSVKDQFSLDDKDGFLRIATTENRQYLTTDGQYVSADFSAPTKGAPPPARPNTVSHVFVLEQKGPWLELTGSVGDLAPNERIYSVRFVDHRGYVVTFRQMDPLFVVDLSAPAQPTVLAALEIPGFSEYMHPLDANHLLTIGRNASNTGRAQGLQLQIFDVTDGANPIQKFTHEYTGQEYGSSEAEYDHKAFTYFADKGLLAFPYYANSANGGAMRSSLELFKVDLAAGFTKLGSIDHSSLFSENPAGYCGGYYGPSVRRGVFLENFVYSISYGGVVVRNANDLAAAGTELALPSPLTNQGYGPQACY